ncbi:MAG TPA: HlyD family efflux transporter periplasmic adaptor subunit [Hellea balneolensis]|uniref:HlyD family efflux transporter periplasmic adaptor subunit n=1 Tax=Hellea balneolensis TaxID=287478 RepID=A0A7C5LVX6_9PROT|nr:HlyD family efflux transporter periplasmic adaptor subunit [Hellea balneolensis]
MKICRFLIIIAGSTLTLSPNALAGTAPKSPQENESQETVLRTHGVLKARQTATLAAGMSAKIISAPYKDGQYFKKGALLVKFDCERLRAEKQAIEQSRQSAQYKYDNASELFNAGAAGSLERDIASSEVAKASAELRVVNARLKDCTIYAPYTGYVQTRHISAFDTPALNAPLLSIIRAGRPEIKLIAPSAWLAWVKPGQKFEFTIDETGKTFPAKLTRTGASVDPVSQTIELTAGFTAPTPGALAGMSGVASFKQGAPE